MELNDDIIQSIPTEVYLKNRKEIKNFYRHKRRYNNLKKTLESEFKMICKCHKKLKFKDIKEK